MANRKSSSEWTRIELEYLAGEYSIREIADRHEISDTAIRKRAKGEGWLRAARKVRLPVRREPPPRTMAPVAESAADCASLAERGRGLVGRMLDELATVTSRVGELEELIDEATADNESANRHEAMARAIGLGGRATTMKTLALALKTLNEASAPIGKKAAQQQKANAIGGGSRFAPMGPPKPTSLN